MRRIVGLILCVVLVAGCATSDDGKKAERRRGMNPIRMESPPFDSLILDLRFDVLDSIEITDSMILEDLKRDHWTLPPLGGLHRRMAGENDPEHWK